MGYRYLFADLLTRVIKDELPLSDVKYGKVLNRPGAFSAKIPYRHPKANRLNIDPARTAVYVERNGTIVWGGILWTARLNDGMIELGGTGFSSYWRRRGLHRTLTYTAQDQLTIARALVNHLQDTTIYPGGNIGIQVATATSGVLRDRTYNWWDFKNAGEAIEQLAAVQNGFDFSYDSAWVSGAIVDTLNWWYPRKGTRSGVTFDLGSNVDEVAWSIDGTSLSTHIDVIGAGEGKAMLTGSADNVGLINAGYPLLETSISNKDVSVPATIQAQANLELAARASIDSVGTIAVRTTADNQVGTFSEGDDLWIRAQDGFVSLDNYYRSMGWTCSTDDEGTETMDVIFASTEAF